MPATESSKIRPHTKRYLVKESAERCVAQADLIDARNELWMGATEKARVAAIRAAGRRRRGITQATDN